MLGLPCHTQLTCHGCVNSGITCETLVWGQNQRILLLMKYQQAEKPFVCPEALAPTSVSGCDEEELKEAMPLL